MADGSKTAKKRNKKDPAVAARNTAKNKARRIARDTKNKAAKAATAQRRATLRRKGSLARIARRIKGAANAAEQTRLVAIEAKMRP